MLSDDLVRPIAPARSGPDHPVIRGAAQNPDVYFQARETVNPYYLGLSDEIVENAMAQLRDAGRTSLAACI